LYRIAYTGISVSAQDLMRAFNGLDLIQDTTNSAVG